MSSDVNQLRAAAIRRHRGKPHIIAALKANIREAILRDAPTKEIAGRVNLSTGKVCKWLHVIGFRLMYVTAEERAHLLQRRGAVVAQKEAA